LGFLTPFFAFICYLALLITTGIFLFDVEEDNECHAPNSATWFGNSDSFYDVSYRYYVVLCLYFTFTLVECVRLLALMVGVLTKSKFIMAIYPLFFLNDLLWVASVITLHVVRLQFSGRYCACKLIFYC
jgi:hypothetical protein